jgi:hypothetical protein
MEYRGFEYMVVRTANPTGWKWTVVHPTRTRTGDSFDRESGIRLAKIAIDKLAELSRGLS